MPEVRVGVSGWRYRSWRGDFYPPGLVQRRELEYVASQMNAAEVNGSFYSLQSPTTYQRFHDQTPDDFCFAVKGGRFVTHFKRLRDVEVPLANFFASGVLALGAKLGPVLWQLPADFTYDAERLDAFFRLLPRTTREAAALASGHDDKVKATLLDAPVGTPLRHVLEPRHASFGEPDALALLREHDVSLVVSDTPGTWPCFEEARFQRHSAGPAYVRLHGHTELYASGYSAASLDGWADKVRAWLAGGRDCHVYFDNDARGRAPHDAVALLRRLSPGFGTDARE